MNMNTYNADEYIYMKDPGKNTDIVTSKRYLPANFKNFWVSAGKSGEMLEILDCRDGL